MKLQKLERCDIIQNVEAVVLQGCARSEKRVFTEGDYIEPDMVAEVHPDEEEDFKMIVSRRGLIRDLHAKYDGIERRNLAKSFLMKVDVLSKWSIARVLRLMQSGEMIKSHSLSPIFREGCCRFSLLHTRR